MYICMNMYMHTHLFLAALCFTKHCKFVKLISLHPIYALLASHALRCHQFAHIHSYANTTTTIMWLALFTILFFIFIFVVLLQFRESRERMREKKERARVQNIAKYNTNHSIFSEHVKRPMIKREYSREREREE